jgi:hypothetical protein
VLAGEAGPLPAADQVGCPFGDGQHGGVRVGVGDDRHHRRVLLCRRQNGPDPSPWVRRVPACRDDVADDNPGQHKTGPDLAQAAWADSNSQAELTSPQQLGRLPDGGGRVERGTLSARKGVKRSRAEDDAKTIDRTGGGEHVPAAVLAVLLAMAGGLLAGAFAAWRITRLRPADALTRVA